MMMMHLERWASGPWILSYYEYISTTSLCGRAQPVVLEVVVADRVVSEEVGADAGRLNDHAADAATMRATICCLGWPVRPSG